MAECCARGCQHLCLCDRAGFCECENELLEECEITFLCHALSWPFSSVLIISSYLLSFCAFSLLPTYLPDTFKSPLLLYFQIFPLF